MQEQTRIEGILIVNNYINNIIRSLLEEEKEYRYFGLCYYLNFKNFYKNDRNELKILEMNLVKEKTKQAIERGVEKRSRYNFGIDSAYLFPLTPAGNDQRINFLNNFKIYTNV